MQTEPMPLLIRPEPTHASDRSDMCECDMFRPEPTHVSDMYECDMCRYKTLCVQWSWYDMYDILQDGLGSEHYSHVDNNVDLVRKIQYLCNNPLLNSVMTPEIVDSIDAHEWFIYDYDKVGGYYREDPITKEQVRVPRRRVYFWDDEMTDYDALCQTIVNILSIIDDWVWEHHDGDIYTLLYDKGGGEKTMIATINEIYDTIIEMYNTMIESEDEECDSVS